MCSISSVNLNLLSYEIKSGVVLVLIFSWDPVTSYIDSKYEEYLNAESRVNRHVLPDTRVHCCLYFISPNGHGLEIQLSISLIKFVLSLLTIMLSINRISVSALEKFLWIENNFCDVLFQPEAARY